MNNKTSNKTKAQTTFSKTEPVSVWRNGELQVALKEELTALLKTISVSEKSFITRNRK